MDKKIKEWLQRDLLYIIAICFALIACLYTLNHTGSAVQACNQHWQEQLQGVTCYKGYDKVMIGGINNGAPITIPSQSDMPYTQEPSK